MLTTPSGKPASCDQFSQLHSVDRSLFRRLQDNCVPGCERGRQFPRRHQERKVPGNNLPANSYWFTESVIKHLSGNGNGLTFDFSGPAGEVLEVFRDLGKIDVRRLLDWLAVVCCFKGSQFGTVLFDQLRELVKHPAAIARANLRPLALESAASGDDGLVDVGLVCFSNFCERVAGRGIRRRKSLA